MSSWVGGGGGGEEDLNATRAGVSPSLSVSNDLGGTLLKVTGGWEGVKNYNGILLSIFLVMIYCVLRLFCASR